MSADLCPQCLWVPSREGHKRDCGEPMRLLEERVEALERQMEDIWARVPRQTSDGWMTIEPLAAVLK